MLEKIFESSSSMSDSIAENVFQVLQNHEDYSIFAEKTKPIVLHAGLNLKEGEERKPYTFEELPKDIRLGAFDVTFYIAPNEMNPDVKRLASELKEIDRLVRARYAQTKGDISKVNYPEKDEHFFNNKYVQFPKISYLENFAGLEVGFEKGVFGFRIMDYQNRLINSYIPSPEEGRKVQEDFGIEQGDKPTIYGINRMTNIILASSANIAQAIRESSLQPEPVKLKGEERRVYTREGLGKIEPIFAEGSGTFSKLKVLWSKKK